jgi:hypothetical protein
MGIRGKSAQKEQCRSRPDGSKEHRSPAATAQPPAQAWTQQSPGSDRRVQLDIAGGVADTLPLQQRALAPITLVPSDSSWRLSSLSMFIHSLNHS